MYFVLHKTVSEKNIKTIVLLIGPPKNRKVGNTKQSKFYFFNITYVT